MTPQNLCGNIQPVIRVCLTISYRDRCPQGLNREVRCNAGAVPPLYWGANPSYTTGMKILGRFGRAMIQSQENCLFDNHRFYPRAMGRGFLHSSCVELLPGIFCRDFLSKCCQLSRIAPIPGSYSFFYVFPRFHAILAFGVDSLAGGSFAGEPPDKNNQFQQ